MKIENDERRQGYIWKNDSRPGVLDIGKLSTGLIVGIVVGVCVISLIVGAVGIGILFLWAGSTESSSGSVDFDLYITARADTDMLEITVLEGDEVSWSEYGVVANGVHLTTLSPSTLNGQRSYFYGLTIGYGDNVEVEIVKIPSNKVVWTKTVLAM